MKYSYYPGCCYHTSAMEYELSSRAACGNLGIQLVEVPDWSCCGSTAAHSTNRMLGLGLAARNLALAESTGLDLVASCAACYQRLAAADDELKRDQPLLAHVNDITGRAYQGRIKVNSILQIIAGMPPADLRARVIKPLSHVKAATYYGCLLLRPPRVGIDDAENPQMMDRVLNRLGATPVDWHFKTECCGAGMGISNEVIVLRLAHRILTGAVDAGADCIVTACPLCHFNLDLRQKKVNRVMGTDFNLPVFYFTQLVGLATGLKPAEISLGTHFVDTMPLLQSI